MADTDVLNQCVPLHFFEQTQPDDVLAVDNRCRDLLMEFYNDLMAGGMTGEEATKYANGADYYLRDFVVDITGENPFRECSHLIRRFGGTWYIINTVEPDIVQLVAYLEGIKVFYRYIERRGLISREEMLSAEAACDDILWYKERIESFWNIEGDGYSAWEKVCPIKTKNSS